MVQGRAGDGLDELDAERPTVPFGVLVAGRTVRFRPAAGPPWRDLLASLRYWPMWLDLFGPTSAVDAAVVEHLPVWRMQALMRAWRVHHGLSAVDADHWRLASMLSKAPYRKAAERDLLEVHRLDLTVEWQSRRWRRLLDLLDGMRRTSYLHEAMSLDEDLAEAVLQRERAGEDVGAAKRRMLDYSPEVEVLSVVADRLAELIQVTGATRGGKRRRITPMPRPETAMHRVRERFARRKHRYTVARVFGYIDAQGRPTGKQPPGGGAPPAF